MEFAHKLKSYQGMIDAELDRMLSVPNVCQKHVFEAMRYGVTGGGKRIRPVLTMAVAELLGGCGADALRVGCAVECVHSYSLIHDDLPCMDNDDLRRGRPTCHKAFGENIALLAGDGLLNLAFELLSDLSAFHDLNAETVLKIIGVLSAASGAYGMIGGQTIDLQNEGKENVSLEELTLLHRLKTGALIRAAAVCGCLVAEKSENKKDFHEKITQISDFSLKLGLAFQIKDDILDVTGTEGELGKPIGSDAVSGKSTFVTLLGLEQAEKRLRQLTSEAVTCLDIFGREADFLRQLSGYLLERTK